MADDETSNDDEAADNAEEIPADAEEVEEAAETAEVVEEVHDGGGHLGTDESDESDGDDDADDAGAAAEPHEATLWDAPVTHVAGQTVLHATVETYIDLLTRLHDDGFEQAIDVIGVDYLEHTRSDLPESIEPERFELVVLLLSLSRRKRVRVRLQVAEGTQVPTLFDLYPGTEAMEREAFDMFGIEFADHPDLSRILMPETWVGHPLRKDFDVGRIPVQFKGAPSQR